ncbi:hypothetical protein ACSF6I_14550 [Escherichia coli]|uniref:hypothetical protein n=1 Tax=Escherichia coli TaxID=562 RepID=UPI003EEB7CE1
MEVVAVADKVVKKTKRQTKKSETVAKARKSHGIGAGTIQPPEQLDIEFSSEKLNEHCTPKLSKNVVTGITGRIGQMTLQKLPAPILIVFMPFWKTQRIFAETSAFKAFSDELRDDLNNSISDDEIIEMLAQHLITKPVFDALFADYNFTDHNPMSMAMQDVLNTLHEHHLEKEANTLNSFYESVKMRADGITTAEGKQQIIVQLYDKFFRNAFPKMTERLGIVYTPVEVVDFIIHSVNDVLKQSWTNIG